MSASLARDPLIRKANNKSKRYSRHTHYDSSDDVRLIDTPQELNSSKIEFLEKQSSDYERSYKIWLIVSTLVNILMIAFTIFVIVVWFNWLLKITDTDIKCVNLKSSIIWVIVVYIVGMFSQVLGLVSGCVKSVIAFLVYELFLVGIFVMRIILDLPTLNNAVNYLEGCAHTDSDPSLNDYIYATIVYCIAVISLFALNVWMIYLIRKLRQAQSAQTTYMEK